MKPVFGASDMDLAAMLSASSDAIDNQLATMIRHRSLWPVIPRGYATEYMEDMAYERWSPIPELYEAGVLCP